MLLCGQVAEIRGTHAEGGGGRECGRHPAAALGVLVAAGAAVVIKAGEGDRQLAAAANKAQGASSTARRAPPCVCAFVFMWGVYVCVFARACMT